MTSEVIPNSNISLITARKWIVTEATKHIKPHTFIRQRMSKNSIRTSLSTTIRESQSKESTTEDGGLMRFSELSSTDAM